MQNQVYGYSEDRIKAEKNIIEWHIAQLLNCNAFQFYELDMYNVEQLVKNNAAALERIRRNYAAQFAEKYPELKPDKLAEMVTLPHEEKLANYPRHHNQVVQHSTLWAERETYLVQYEKGRYTLAPNAEELLKAKHAYHATPETQPLIASLTKVREAMAELAQILPENMVNEVRALRTWADKFFTDVSRPPQEWKFRNLDTLGPQWLHSRREHERRFSGTAA